MFRKIYQKKFVDSWKIKYIAKIREVVDYKTVVKGDFFLYFSVCLSQSMSHIFRHICVVSGITENLICDIWL